MWMLGDRLHCLAPDLPGFGRSGPAGSGGTTLGAGWCWQPLCVSVSPSPCTCSGTRWAGRSACSWPAGTPADPLADSGLAGAADLIPMRTSIQLPVIAVPGIGPRLATRIAQLPVEQRVQATMNLVYAKAGHGPPQRVAEAQGGRASRRRTRGRGRPSSRRCGHPGDVYFDRGPDAPWKLAERIDDQC